MQTGEAFTDTVFMVRPATFRANRQTAASNEFQRASSADAAVILDEFDRSVERLEAVGVRVHVGQDTPDPPKPDAVFPNNWVSFHADGTLVTYAMAAPNRRAEVRRELIDELERDLGFRYPRWLDLRGEARHGRYLEGTGSLVLDRASRRALVARSPRNDSGLVADWAREMGYAVTEVTSVGPSGQPVYHTNVLVALGPDFVVVASSWLPRESRRRVDAWITEAGRISIELDEAEARSFGANALALSTSSHPSLWVLSEGALAGLRPQTRVRLESRAELLSLPISTIEAVGGGSARCLLAEVFRPNAEDSKSH